VSKYTRARPTSSASCMHASPPPRTTDASTRITTRTPFRIGSPTLRVFAVGLVGVRPHRLPVPLPMSPMSRSISVYTAEAEQPDGRPPDEDGILVPESTVRVSYRGRACRRAGAVSRLGGERRCHKSPARPPDDDRNSFPLRSSVHPNLGASQSQCINGTDGVPRCSTDRTRLGMNTDLQAYSREENGSSGGHVSLTNCARHGRAALCLPGASGPRRVTHEAWRVRVRIDECNSRS
jgi:hypothetical protein